MLHLLLTATLVRKHHYSHFTDEETAQSWDSVQVMELKLQVVRSFSGWEVSTQSEWCHSFYIHLS